MDRTRILSGNEAFRAAGGYAGLAIMPKRRVIVIGCADPRVDPERILGLEMGDAAVIRNIGGRVTRPTLATMAGLGQVGARIAKNATSSDIPPGMHVIVLHHTDCGILQLADDPESLAGFIGTDAETIAGMHISDPVAAVARDVAVLRNLPIPNLKVWGLVYNVEDGRIDIAVAPLEDSV